MQKSAPLARGEVERPAGLAEPGRAPLRAEGGGDREGGLRGRRGARLRRPRRDPALAAARARGSPGQGEGRPRGGEGLRGGPRAGRRAARAGRRRPTSRRPRPALKLVRKETPGPRGPGPAARRPRRRGPPSKTPRSRSPRRRCPSRCGWPPATPCCACSRRRPSTPTAFAPRTAALVASLKQQKRGSSSRPTGPGPRPLHDRAEGRCLQARDGAGAMSCTSKSARPATW